MFTNLGLQAGSAYEKYPKLDIFIIQLCHYTAVEPGRLGNHQITVSAHNAIIIIQSLQPATIQANYIVQGSEPGNNLELEKVKIICVFITEHNESSQALLNI